MTPQEAKALEANVKNRLLGAVPKVVDKLLKVLDDEYHHTYTAKEMLKAAELILSRTIPTLGAIQVSSTTPVIINYTSPLSQAAQVLNLPTPANLHVMLPEPLDHPPSSTPAVQEVPFRVSDRIKALQDCVGTSTSSDQ